MKTIINIGTDRGNIKNIVFDKEFKDITSKECYAIAREAYPNCVLIGWADVTLKENKNENNSIINNS